MPNKILVTGATGYIASRLIPLLLNAGYEVRCLARNPDRLKGRSWYPKIQIFTGDVTQPSTLLPAMQGISVAYYLIHSMSAGSGYHHIDLESAENFSWAARDAGVENIIYLGGLANQNDPGLSLHMKSRISCGEALRVAGVPVTEFRAGVIVGPGSVSFEMIRFIAEQFPVIIGPRWLRHRTQPVAAHNVLEFLMAALVVPEARGKVIEIGSLETYEYIEIMSHYAKIRGLRRFPLLVPFAPVWLMALFIELLTPVNSSYAYPLIQSLQNDSVVMDRGPLSLFPDIALEDFSSSVQQALAHTHPNEIERIWLYLSEDVYKLMHEGMLIEYRRSLVNDPKESVFNNIKRFLDPNFHLRVGILQSFQLDLMTRDTLRLKVSQKIPGEAWIEWKVTPSVEGTMLEQTIFFAPKGLLGFVSWYLILLFDRSIFSRLFRQAAAKP